MESKPTVWVVDPISYSGMVYTDVAQVQALRAAGARAILAGSDSWILDPGLIPRRAVFRGTSGSGHRLRRGLAYAVSALRLVLAVRVARPDVVHWQYTELPIIDLLAATAIRSLGVPQAYTAHELLPWAARRYHVAVFRAFYSQMRAIVVHDDDRRAQLVDRCGVPPPRIHVLPLGDYAAFAAPDLPQSEARARLGLPLDVPVALFFGAIRPSKGLEVLAEAWPEVRGRVPDACLVIAGKPFKGLDTAAALAPLGGSPADLGVQTDFRQVSASETNDYYRAADVVVLPYHDIGTSGVLRYAYNSRRAVVATRVGEHPAHVQHGRTGLLLAPGDPAALATALADALSDRAALASMGEAGARYAAATFGWPQIGHALLGIYRTIRRRSEDFRSLR